MFMGGSMILKDSEIRLHQKSEYTYKISMLLNLDRFSIMFNSPENFTLHEAKVRMQDLARDLDLTLNIQIESM